MACADLVLFGHIVELEPTVLTVYDALGTQDMAVVAAVKLAEHLFKRFARELLRRFLAPGGKDVVGMVMVAGAFRIVALFTVVVMMVMRVLVVVVMMFIMVMVVFVMLVLMLMVMLVLMLMLMVMVVVVVMLVFVFRKGRNIINQLYCCDIFSIV